ncbi:putative integrase, phage SPbeta [Peribacillus asahii]|uniref:Putative integrase, phage SPbeta n=1 Tax=Peribacillus asahii TaxID=228899 RepID=A0A3T0KTP6_9BACI|nr:site-specific integrase [Peribacillus asahii]AZV43625.1 putative integrase, phage SPbeta [Peribacillus asahii]
MLYNENIKEEFLNEYNNEATQDTMRHLFLKSAETEDMLKKDLYDFTLEEIGTIMYEINPKTTNSARTYGRFINYYIDWAIEHYRTGNVSSLNGEPIDHFDKYIDKDLKLLYSEEEIIEMEDKLINYQDKVVIRMLFEGVEGDGLSELLNLQEDDVDFEKGILHLKDDKKGERTLEIKDEDKRCLEFIQKASGESYYHFKNGEGKGKNKGIELLENNYVVKSVRNRAINLERADKHLIYRRLATVSKMLEYPYLNAKNIMKSGMLKMAKDLYVRDGELEKVQLTEIAERFNATKVKINNTLDYNLTPIKSVVTIDNLKELYPEIFM